MMWQAREQQIGTLGPFRNPHTTPSLRGALATKQSSLPRPALRASGLLRTSCGASRRPLARNDANITLWITRFLDGSGHGARLCQASLLLPYPSLHNASDRAQLQNAGDRQSAFSYAPDNIHWPYAVCTEGIRHEQTSGVCACGSWLLELVLRQAQRQPSLACIGLLWADPMNDCLRRFCRKVIVGLAQTFANVVGKPAIFACHFG
jgi:hypothetical protein